jgi:hypothetical protein
MLKRSMVFIFIVTIVNVATGQIIPKGYKLAYEQSFESKNFMEDFSFTQPEKWITGTGNPGSAIEFTGISDYQPPFRSPHTIGLLNKMAFGSFVLEAELLQTGKEYGHRDMCVIFGFRDSSHFYYTHVATKMDDNAHQVMLVDQAPRKKISTFTTGGIEWGQEQWHKLRIERDVATGSIRIFFDGQLIQEASDKSFGVGYIGFGSFDDSGKVDNIRIWSPEAVAARADFFQKKQN